MIGSALLLSALLVQTQPAASEAEKNRAENRLLVHQEFDPIPRKPSRPISKIVKVTLEGGHVHVEPLMEPTDGAVECDATDWPGRLEVDIKPRASLVMHLKQIQLLDHDATVCMTEVTTAPDYLQINRSTETATGMTSVTLIQSRQFAEQGNPTRLTIQQTTEDANTDPPQVVLSEESFAKLRQQHPAEVRTYFLPILRDLGAESLLLSSDPRSAWQVLGKDIAPDPALEQKLSSVLKQFDADDFATRAKAEDQLNALGPAGAAALEQRDLTRLTFDTRAAVYIFLQARHPLRPEVAQAAGYSVNFLLDTVLLNDATLRKAALNRLAKVTGEGLELPADLNESELEKRVEAYRAKFAAAPATQP
ncbi:MAG: hypothetical protein ACTHM6_17220 [Tepidisphaeraceae bacterium]